MTIKDSIRGLASAVTLSVVEDYVKGKLDDLGMEAFFHNSLWIDVLEFDADHAIEKCKERRKEYEKAEKEKSRKKK